MLKILIISVDQNLKSFSERNFNNPDFQIITYCSTTDPLDIMSQVCSTNPSILVLDDDFINPNTVHLLTSIKKVNPKLSIIFITSNTSIELGRQIHSIGVKFYLMKPYTDNEFTEFLNSIIKEQAKIIY